MNKSIKSTVAYFVKKFDTRDPFEIADRLNVEYIIGPMGNYSGCYLYLKRHRCIFLNNELPEQDMRLVMAHELGHAILHRRENCYFIRNKTFLSTAKIEREANTFAHLCSRASDPGLVDIRKSRIYKKPACKAGRVQRNDYGV